MTPKGRGIVVFALSALLPLASIAGSYSVHPVKVVLSEQRQAATLRVSNPGPGPVTVELVTKDWSQPGGEDTLTDTRDIIAMPPMFTIEAGGKQIVRVGLRRTGEVRSEQAYRLLLKEILPAAETRPGLNLALNVSVPVFVKPAQPAQPDLAWQARRLGGGKLALRVENRGAGHAKFTEWSLLSAGERIARQHKLEYVLPGAQKQWTVSPEAMPRGGESVDIVLVSAGREVRMQATVE